jgi:sec-independent protein translocase protein TatA
MAVVPVSLIFPSGQEWIIILIVGIVLFGRRLPEVGKQVGRTIIQLRQGMQKLRDEIDLDADLREVKETVTDVQYDLRESVDVEEDLGLDEDTRRIARDPKGLLEDLTDEALSAPAPAPPEAGENSDEVKDVPQAGGSLFVKEAAEEEKKGE